MEGGWVPQKRGIITPEEPMMEEKDKTCKFMRPHGPTKDFNWPCADDVR